MYINGKDINQVVKFCVRYQNGNSKDEMQKLNFMTRPWATTVIWDIVKIFVIVVIVISIISNLKWTTKGVKEND